MPLPPLPTTPYLDWRYVAEGGANLVLSFSGPPDSPYYGRALRLRKRKKRVRVGKADEAVPSEVGIVFGREVIEPLLGAEQVPEMELVALERPWLEALVRRLRDKGARPAEREEEDEVDLDAREAVAVEDLVSGRGVLAVEIKPKWGFLPSPAHLSPPTAPLKRSYCRFCMHRYHKRVSSSSGNVNEDLAAALAEHANGYCPLDLYSREPARVQRALDCLYDGWARSSGEGNSLRIFLDGQKLSPQDPAALDQLTNALSSLAARSSALSDSHSRTVIPPCTLSSTLLPILLASPLLFTLSRLQATLDCLDIEGLATLLAADERTEVDITAPSPNPSPLGAQPALEEWETWMGEHLPLLQPASSASSTTDRPLAFETHLRCEQPHAAILAYLLSATFKDCSLIVRIPLPSPSFSASPSASPSASSDSSPPPPIPPTVKAIDLDPKPLNRLGKYWRMDREIVSGWGEMLDGLEEEERASVRRCEE